MWFYLLAGALLLHTFFWGAGLAWLTLPRAWQRWWWAFAPGFGLALQSSVVWAGAHTPLAGTQVYAWPSELIPVVLLGLAWRRAGNLRRFLGAWRGAIGVAGLVLAAGWLLLSPMATASRRPTSLSLGSCDAADYAAGARVMQEFSRDDRTGFLGLPEVTRVRSTDYFFDFWLRLNHFTPSALIAHNGVILGSKPHELTSVTGVALALLNVPLMLFLARVALGLRGGPLLVLTGLLAFSPLQTYAVDQTALGQLLAAQGIMLLTVAVLGGVRRRNARPLGGVMLAGFSILACGYNMILPVCLAPAGGWLLAQAWLRRDWRSVGRVCALLVVTLALCAVLFWTRFSGLVERFSLFNEHNFGWPVSRLWPEGWLGLVADAALKPWPAAIRVVLLALVVAGWLLGMGLLWRRQRARALIVLMFVAPLAVGWAILDHEARSRANASYDTYKLLAVFQPELLIGLGGWMVVMQGRRRGLRLAARVLGAGLLIGNLVAGAEFRRAMVWAPLRVDQSLLEISRIETDPRVRSVNIRVEDFWARLWANTFLLRLPQYFVTHSYEGRRDTPLRGEWDLSDSVVRALPLAPADFITVNQRFHLVRAAATDRVLVRFGDGWHQPEQGGGQSWRWTADNARLLLANSSAKPQRMRLALSAQAIGPRRLQVWLNEIDLGSRAIGLSRETFDYGAIILPPGDSVVRLQTTGEAVVSANGDPRQLSLAVYDMTFQAVGADR